MISGREAKRVGIEKDKGLGINKVMMKKGGNRECGLGIERVGKDMERERGMQISREGVKRDGEVQSERKRW